MRKIIVLVLYLMLITTLYQTLPAVEDWTEYVSADKTYCFNYPSGWTVKESDSSILVKEPNTGRKLLMVAMSDTSDRDAGAMVKPLSNMVRQDFQGLAIAAPAASGPNSVYFTFSFNQGETGCNGDAFVVKDNGQAIWFSYSGPAATYHRKEAVTVLTTFVKSLKGVAEPQASGLEKNADAFMFVLEFALGAPLPQEVERDIEQRLIAGWQGKSAEELEKFDAYPGLVKMILSLDQQRLEELRGTLEQTIRQWLDETGTADPAAAAIVRHLEAQHQVLAAGTPPLTQSVARGYSELMAFSRLLNRDPSAKPAAISPSDVKHLQKTLISGWSQLSSQQKQAVAAAPALWITARTVLRYGTGSAAQSLRNKLAKLNPPAPTNTPAASKSKKPRSMLNHYVLMETNRQTFNTYMWSRGFHRTIYGH